VSARCGKVLGRGCVTGPVGTRCFACGDAVCRPCSTILRRYYRWTGKRLCWDCASDYARTFGFDTGEDLAAYTVALRAAGFYPDVCIGHEVTTRDGKRWVVRHDGTISEAFMKVKALTVTGPRRRWLP
jgi:hypothetical protein